MPKKSKRAAIVLFVLLASIASFTLIKNERVTKINDCSISVDRKCINLELADSNTERVKGLSGRKHMSETEGMLFVFDSPGRQCIWMKDMKFPLDIIWLDKNKSITSIEKDVKPETYPTSFCGNGNDKYVVELNSGVADRAELRIGQKINL